MNLPERLSHEVFNAGLATTDMEILKLGKYKGSRFAGEAALLMASNTWRSRVHPKFELNQSLLNEKGNFRPRYEDIFMHSALGIILAENFRIVQSTGEDVTELVRRNQSILLTKNLGCISSGHEITWVSFARVSAPPDPKLFTKSRIDDFVTDLRFVISDSLGVSRKVNPLSFTNAAILVYEAFRNAIEHGSTDLVGAPLPGIKFITAKRLNCRHLNINLKQKTAVSEYLALLQERSIISERDFLLELTVCDSGVGIPARMGGIGEQIYSAPISKELESFTEAFEAKGTSKPKITIGAGLGLFKAQQIARETQGVLLARAGRHMILKHFLNSPREKFRTDLAQWQVEELPYSRGTCITLLMPWPFTR